MFVVMRHNQGETTRCEYGLEVWEPVAVFNTQAEADAYVCNAPSDMRFPPYDNYEDDYLAFYYNVVDLSQTKWCLE